MRAALLHGPKDMRIGDVPEPPSPGPGQVKIKVTKVGVCASDVAFYLKGGIGDAVITEPFITGHESAGEICEIGAGVTKVKPGDRVAIEPGIPCRHCRQCVEGHYNLCRKMRFCGTPPTHGVFTEFYLTWESLVFPIPESMSDEEAALLEPLSCALHAVGLSSIRPGDRALVLSCGPIGLLVTQVLAANGAGQIFVTDLLDERLSLAARFGATRTIHAGREDPAAIIRRETNDAMVDYSYETAGVAGTVKQSLDLLGPGGEAVWVGIPKEDALSIPIHTTRRKGITIKFSRRYKHTYERAIRLVASGKIDVQSLITHHLPLDQVGEAMEMVANYRDGVIKAIISP